MMKGKNRLSKAMETNGITVKEAEAVISSQLPSVSKRSKKKIIDRAFNDYYTFLKGAPTEMIMALAVLCNVSSDYLLGLSDSMNTIG